MSRNHVCVWATAMALAASVVLAGMNTQNAWGQEESHAAATSQPAARQDRGGPVGVPQGLEGAMKDMKRMYKALKAEAADPTKIEQSLKDIAQLQRDVVIAKGLVPPSVNHQSGDAKAEELTNYRAMMISMIRSLLDLEEAVVAKKADDVKKVLGEIEELQKQGHKEFAPKDD